MKREKIGKHKLLVLISSGQIITHLIVSVVQRWNLMNLSRGLNLPKPGLNKALA